MKKIFSMILASAAIISAVTIVTSCNGVNKDNEEKQEDVLVGTTYEYVAEHSGSYSFSFKANNEVLFSAKSLEENIEDDPDEVVRLEVTGTYKYESPAVKLYFSGDESTIKGYNSQGALVPDADDDFLGNVQLEGVIENDTFYIVHKDWTGVIFKKK